MNLAAEVKQKNDHLLLQGIELQRQLHLTLNKPAFSSFLITFVLAPLLVGAVAGVAAAPKGSRARQLVRIALPGLRFIPFL